MEGWDGKKRLVIDSDCGVECMGRNCIMGELKIDSFGKNTIEG